MPFEELHSGGKSIDVIDGGAGSDFFYEKADANATINGSANRSASGLGRH